MEEAIEYKNVIREYFLEYKNRDQVRIKVSKVNVDFREIDFELVSVKEDNRLVDAVVDKVEADEKDGE